MASLPVGHIELTIAGTNGDQDRRRCMASSCNSELTHWPLGDLNAILKM